MATFHCARAWLGGDELASDVLVEEESGNIVAVQKGAPPPPGAHRLAGTVLPGFANAHSHAFHRALRGRVGESAENFWSWRVAMYELADRLDPTTLHDLALGAFAEMACAGFTAVGEFHYLRFDPEGHEYDEPHAMAVAVAEAARAAGVRLTLLDACYLEGSPGLPVDGTQRRFADPSAEAWARRADDLGAALGDDVVVGAAIHSVRTVPPGAASTVAAWADRHGVPLHAHVSEQTEENEAALAAYGATPTVVLERAGALSERFVAVHATHLTGADRAELARHGASVCVCPTTERELADGLVELAPLRDAGIALCLGTDSQAVVDPFEEQRCLEGHERLRTRRRGTLPPAALLEAAGAAGHRAIGRPRGGVLRAGAPCDLVHVADGSLRLAGVDDASVGGILAAAVAADVRDVVVGGRTVVRDGVHVARDVAGLLGAAVRRVWS